MGYDFYSERKGSGSYEDEGYFESDAHFRLNIWGMGWMRGVMMEADPKLEDIMFKFCSNDGEVVSVDEGARIAAALRTYLKDNPVGAVPKRKARKLTPHEQAAKDMSSQLEKMFGMKTIVGDTGDPIGKKLTQEDADTIREFAEYNETQAPYRVC